VRKNIRIENPLAGAGFTSRNRAKRFVARGLAEWVEAGVSIRFLRDPRDHRETSTTKQVDMTRYWYQRASNTGLAQLAELANLPMVAPQVLLGIGRTQGRESAHVPGGAGAACVGFNRAMKRQKKQIGGRFIARIRGAFLDYERLRKDFCSSERKSSISAALLRSSSAIALVEQFPIRNHTIFGG
jgi:hypothetical protein